MLYVLLFFRLTCNQEGGWGRGKGEGVEAYTQQSMKEVELKHHLCCYNAVLALFGVDFSWTELARFAMTNTWVL